MSKQVSRIPKVAVVVLTRGYDSLESYTEFVARNRSIVSALDRDQRSSNILYSVDYLVFHQGNISFSQRVALAFSSLPTFLMFKDIRHFFDLSSCSIPSYPPICHETSLSRIFDWGYKRMCSFWFVSFLRFTQGYDYIVRVDEDCCVSNLPLSSII